MSDLGLAGSSTEVVRQLKAALEQWRDIAKNSSDPEVILNAEVNIDLISGMLNDMPDDLRELVLVIHSGDKENEPLILLPEDPPSPRGMGFIE